MAKAHPLIDMKAFEAVWFVAVIVAVIADLAMAPYASAVYSANYGNGAYGNDASLPLLTSVSGAFCGDMVFANRQVGGRVCGAVTGL